MYNAYAPKGGFPVTPSDTAPLNPGTGYGPTAGTPVPIATQLYIGGAGNVSLISEDGSPLLYQGVPAGSVIWMRTVQVKATGTTATNILALY